MPRNPTMSRTMGIFKITDSRFVNLGLVERFTVMEEGDRTLIVVIYFPEPRKVARPVGTAPPWGDPVDSSITVVGDWAIQLAAWLERAATRAVRGLEVPPSEGPDAA